MNPILSQLRSAAVALPGRDGLWVRAHVAKSILGIRGSCHGVKWQRRGRLHPVQVAVPVCRANLQGRETYWPIDDLACILATWRRNRRWTNREWARAEVLMATMPLREVAAALGRTFTALDSEMDARGRTIHVVLRDRHRMIGRGELARIAGRSPWVVSKWLDREGLPFHLVPTARRGTRYVRLPEFVAWLKQNWSIAIGLSPAVLARLRLRLVDGRVVDARKEAA